MQFFGVWIFFFGFVGWGDVVNCSLFLPFFWWFGFWLFFFVGWLSVVFSL